MSIFEAARLLGLSGEITSVRVKKAWRAAVRKHHPDIHPGGEELTKRINAAYETLKTLTGTAQYGQRK